MGKKRVVLHSKCLIYFERYRNDPGPALVGGKERIVHSKLPIGLSLSCPLDFPPSFSHTKYRMALPQHIPQRPVFSYPLRATESRPEPTSRTN